MAPDRRRTASIAVGVIVVVALAVGAGSAFLGGHPAASPFVAPPPPCIATVSGERVALDFEQAQNATTIAAVGKRLGLADHAVTIALAVAYQESRLLNLDHGDRDSLGLFQQRPSQGWGTQAEIMTPHRSAATFYRHLGQVDGWSALPVTVVAQKVQRSATPDAYGRWESVSRVLAQALTGEAAAGFACRAPVVTPKLDRAAVTAAMATELGSASLDSGGVPARGWVVASWLVGHARAFGIRSVSFGGQRWTAASRTWRTAPSTADPTVVAFRA